MAAVHHFCSWVWATAHDDWEKTMYDASKHFAALYASVPHEFGFRATTAAEGGTSEEYGERLP